MTDILSPTEIRAALQSVALSEAFRNTPQLVSFLTFVVERSLAGEAQEIKGYTIATQALGRPADFDPQIDPIVRVEAGRLRRALELYYAEAGQDEPVHIQVPRGSYVPRFERVAVRPEARPHERAGGAEGRSAPAPAGQTRAARSAGAAGARQTAQNLPATRTMLVATAIVLGLVVLAGLFAAGAGLIAISLRQEGAPTATATLIATQPIVAVGTIERMEAPAISPEALRSTLLDVLARFDEIAVVDLAAGPQPWSASGYLLSLALGGSDVTARLTHRLSGEVIWTRTFEASRDTQFVETDLARRIGTDVAQPYGVLAADLRRRSRIDARTRCLLMAHDYWRTPSGEAHAQARDCLEAVVAAHPNAATALAALAVIYLDEHRAGRNPRPVPLDRALAVARRAIEIEPEGVRTNQALKAVLAARGDAAEAQTIAKRLLEFHPQDTDLLTELGPCHVRAGRCREGVEPIDRAAGTSPAYPQ